MRKSFFALVLWAVGVSVSSAQGLEGGSSLTAVINAAVRGNSSFLSFDQVTQERTFSAMSELASSVAKDHKFSFVNESSWGIVLRHLSMQSAGTGFAPSVSYRLVEDGSQYWNFGNDLQNMSKGFNSVIVSQENTRSPGVDSRWPDVLTGDLNADVPHYQCTAIGDRQVRVYGLDAMAVAQMCFQQAYPVTGGVNNICQAKPDGFSCAYTSWATGLRVDYVSTIVEGGNQVSCPSGMLFIADSVDPFSVSGQCVVSSKKVEGSGKSMDFGSALALIPSDDLSKPLNPEIIALLTNLLWEQAALQPGYEGVPFQGSGGVSAGGVSAGAAGAGLSMPVVSDVANALPSNDSSYWAVPVDSGELNPGGEPDTGGGDPVEKSGFERWFSDMSTGFSGLILVLLALAGLLVTLYITFRGVKILLRHVKGA